MEPSATSVGPGLSVRLLAPALAVACLSAAGGYRLATRGDAVATTPGVLRVREPGLDRAPPGADAIVDDPVAGGRLIPGRGKVAEIAGAWPQFRGPARDGLAARPGRIAADWSVAPPRALWSVSLGEGYAGAVALNGRVYIMDYDQAAHSDAIRCLSLADGVEIWRYTYPVKVKRNHGMSRTVPAVTDKYVVTMGPKCHVACLDAVTGKRLWFIDLVADYGAIEPPWYAGQCPLIEDGKAILAPCGDILMMAVDCATGSILWTTPNTRGWQATHSSIMPAELAGRRTYVYCGSGGIAGVAAADGTPLWDSDAWRIRIATIASPVPVGADRLFLAGGYNGGSMMLRVTARGEGYAADPLFRLPAGQFGATQQTPVLYKENIYGVRPDGQLACLDLDGKVLWASGSAQRFGLGPFLILGDEILALNDTGLLSRVAARPDAFELLGQAPVLEGHDAWAPMCYVAGRLLVRDLTRMVCLDLEGGVL